MIVASGRNVLLEVGHKKLLLGEILDLSDIWAEYTLRAETLA